MNSVSTYEYSAELGCKYGELGPVIKWCEKNCKGDWTINFDNHKIASNGTLYTFQFDTQEDYINFLIWKK